MRSVFIEKGYKQGYAYSRATNPYPSETYAHKEWAEGYMLGVDSRDSEDDSDCGEDWDFQ